MPAVPGTLHQRRSPSETYEWLAAISKGAGDDKTVEKAERIGYFAMGAQELGERFSLTT
ncbi:hypothetical protein ACWCQQ_15755 [Streptomyces sp. NPDC002143]